MDKMKLLQFKILLKAALNWRLYPPFLLIAFIMNSVVWSVISVLKFFALNASVFDLGLSMQSLWSVYNLPLFSSAATSRFLYTPITYLLFPLGLLNNYPFLLVIQSITLSWTVFPIYWVGRRMIKDTTASLLLALSFLLNFEMAGSYWFDFHFQIFFVPMFILGVYLFMIGRLRYAVVMLFVSGMVRYPYMAFPALYGLAIVLEQVYLLKWNEGKFVRKNLIYGIVLIAATSFFLLISILVLGTHSISSTAHLTQNSGVGSAIGLKLATIVIMLAPFLFIPLLSKRWLAFYFPTFFIILVSGMWMYTFPGFFALQYPTGIVPFLYLGLIDGLAVLTRTRSKDRALLPKKITRHFSGLKLSALVLVVIVVMAAFLQPYGIFNAYTGASFQLSQETHVNTTLYDQLMNMIGLIPNNEKYVLFQNNMPQMLPRPVVEGISPLVAGVTFGSNISPGHYPLIVDGQAVNVPIVYAIDDPYSQTFYSGPASMYQFIQLLYSTNHYGVLAEASGMTLIEQNYTGPIKYFIPLAANFNVQSFFNSSSLMRFDPTTATITNPNGVNFWYGPYTFLSPGRYQLTVQLMTNNKSAANHLDVQVTADKGKTILDNLVISGSRFAQTGVWSEITVNFSCNNTYGAVEFRGMSTMWNGTLQFKGMNLRQIAPPSQPTCQFNSSKSSTVMAAKRPISQHIVQQTVVKVSTVIIVAQSTLITANDSWRYVKKGTCAAVPVTDVCHDNIEIG